MDKAVEELTAEIKSLDESGKIISPGEIVIGTITGLDKNLQPQVDFAGNQLNGPLTAVSTLAIYKQHIGRQAAILFANGDSTRPVIIGLIHNPLYEILENYTNEPAHETLVAQPEDVQDGVDDISVDGKKVVIEGKNEIVLKCGASSITLTKEGKILIRGKYLLNRSTGINRILGGSVQIN